MRTENFAYMPGRDEHSPRTVDLAQVEATGKLIAKEQGPLIDRILKAAMRLAEGNSVGEFQTLMILADGFSKAITPYTPCKDGCSHCCHMAVAISDTEAHIIAGYIGKKPAVMGTIEKFIEDTATYQQEYAGVPCTFLEEGKCSIYSVRPIACRTHHNLAPTNENCKITKDLAVAEETWSLNVFELSQAAVSLAMNMGDGFADLRHYFPNGRK